MKIKFFFLLCITVLFHEANLKAPLKADYYRRVLKESRFEALQEHNNQLTLLVEELSTQLDQANQEIVHLKELLHRNRSSRLERLRIFFPQDFSTHRRYTNI